MSLRIAAICAAAALALGVSGVLAPGRAGTSAPPAVSAYGVVSVKSDYGLTETLTRLKKDIADKKLMFFQEIDEAKLAADAGVNALPSVLLVFGNPALGTQFITANQEAGIDWPVRLLVYQNAKGEVWLAYNDFGYIAKRHAIADRGPQFKMASEVIASIASSVSAH
jgi:uncharacterized protein (DUF302 family)